MSVSTLEAGVVRVGNGVTTVFSFSFEGKNVSEIKVSNIVGEALVPVLSGFVVALNPGGLGGTVTFTVAPANALSFYIYRDTAQTQLVDLSSQQRYDPKVVSDVWDKLTFMVQELNAEVERAVKVIPGSSADTLLAAIFAAEASTASDAASAAAAAATLAAMQASLNAAIASANTAAGDLNTFLAGVSVYAKTLLDDANAGAAQTTLGISTFIKTLLDDADKSAAATTLGYKQATPVSKKAASGAGATSFAVTTASFVAPCDGVVKISGGFDATVAFNGATTTLTASLGAVTNADGINGPKSFGTIAMTSGQSSTFTASVANGTAGFLLAWVTMEFIPTP